MCIGCGRYSALLTFHGSEQRTRAVDELFAGAPVKHGKQDAGPNGLMHKLVFGPVQKHLLYAKGQFTYPKWRSGLLNREREIADLPKKPSCLSLCQRFEIGRRGLSPTPLMTMNSGANG